MKIHFIDNYKSVETVFLSYRHCGVQHAYRMSPKYLCGPDYIAIFFPTLFPMRGLQTGLDSPLLGLRFKQEKQSKIRFIGVMISLGAFLCEVLQNRTS